MLPASEVPTLSAPAAPRKKLGRRARPERSQTLRRAIQFGFLALNAWIGLQFYLWVRFYENGGASWRVSRPAGVEGWLPIASLMNLKVLLLSGQLPRIHPAGLFLFMAFLAASWIFRKSFCGWVCSVGTISEYAGKFGRKLLGRNFHLPRWIDIPLRGLKYLFLSFFLFAVVSMSVESIHSFLESPYGAVDDVKMLNFFRGIETTGIVVIGMLVIASFLIQNFWCRYLCPYGALMGLAALASPLRIRREASLCIDCAKCAKACPSALPVDKLISIRSAECISCMQCVAVCPAEGALQLCAPGRRNVPAWAVATGILVLFFGAYSYATFTGHWNTNLPERVYFQLVPHANEFEHP